MDELLRRYANELDAIVHGGTYSDYTALGLLADFARSIRDFDFVNNEDN